MKDFDWFISLYFPGTVYIPHLGSPDPESLTETTSSSAITARQQVRNVYIPTLGSPQYDDSFTDSAPTEEDVKSTPSPQPHSAADSHSPGDLNPQFLISRIKSVCLCGQVQTLDGLSSKKLDMFFMVA